MNDRVHFPEKAKHAAASPPQIAPLLAGTLQRKCACGGSGGECAECKKKKDTLPNAASTGALTEPRFGHDFGRVRVQAARPVSVPSFNGSTYEEQRSVGGSCPKCRQEGIGSPAYYGDLDKGVPQLTPDAGAPAQTTDAGAPVPKTDAGAPAGGDCSSICDRAYANSSLNFGGGGVICDGSTKCACVFDVPPLHRGQCPDFDANVRAHETRHLGDVDCNPTGGLHRPGFRNPSAANASECTHRRESMAELDAVIPRQTGACKPGMQTIRAMLASWVQANCGGGH
jgi:hypothetical protein